MPDTQSVEEVFERIRALDGRYHEQAYLFVLASHHEGYGMVLAVVLGLMIVAAATLLRTTMPLILGWVSIFLFLRIIAEVLVDGLHYDVRWRLLDLWNNLGLVGRACLGFDPSRLDLTGGQPTFLEAGLTLLGVCTVCLILLLRRTRGVPIVR